MLPSLPRRTVFVSQNPFLVDEIDFPNYFQSTILASNLVSTQYLHGGCRLIGCILGCLMQGHTGVPSTSHLLRTSGLCTLACTARLQNGDTI
jgi:hypothetical protein